MAASLTPLARPRLLLMAEAVTLAHLARPAAIGSALEDVLDVHLACAPRFNHLLGDTLSARHSLYSIEPEQFMAALARGAPLYDDATLNAYVEDDLRVIARVQPEVIIGDMRLSLAVSAALAGVPYIALTNAYWSPFCRQRFTVPELPFTALLGPQLGQLVFSVARPVAFTLHSLPMHRLRRRHGLPGLGLDLRCVYTHGDFTLYADPPDLFSMRELPAHHRFIGPVVWSPETALPEWWDDLPSDGPLLYVTLGSSGQASLLPVVLDALSQCAVTAVVASAGAPVPDTLPDNVFVTDYLPGDAAVGRADLVLCNGGSPTSHQALAQGVPVLGLAGNLDQYLNMAAVSGVGAGCCLRSGTVDARALALQINTMLSDPAYQHAAAALAVRWQGANPQQAVATVLAEILGPLPGSSADGLRLPLGASL